MLFNSISFAIFLPLVFVLYWSLPHRFRWILILCSSLYFYMSWSVKYVFLILITTSISYVSAILLEKEKNQSKKKIIILFSAFVSLGILFIFKYFNFLSDSLVEFLSWFSIKINGITLKLLLPVGISFYTFQTLSYVIDVYNGKVSAEHHFGYYATFVTFFPQLVAGPIERTSSLLPQIKAKHYFDYKRATYGIKLMAWGFFKKVVLADTLSPFVSMVYSNPRSYYGFALVLATVFFSFQIYCDFSGYSDIAIGCAKLFDIDLMTNFKSPYFSQSIKEFWNRWHISLSTWFRDYIYIPLGGNRVKKIRNKINVMITFLVSGLWHGASWNYVIWGGLHGFLQIIESFLIPNDKLRSKGIIKYLRMIAVWIVCTFVWIFFISKSLSDAIYVITHLFVNISSPINYIVHGFNSLQITASAIIVITISLLLLSLYDYKNLENDVINEISKYKIIKRWIIYILFVLVLIFFSEKSIAAEFVYFQF